MNWTGYMKEARDARIAANKPIADAIKTNADTKEAPKYKRRRAISNYDWDSDTHHWANGKRDGAVL